MANVLTAKEGYVFTNGETFSNIIRLGKNDSVDNWREITEVEAERLQSEEIEPSDTEATETAEKAAAYDILMGVSE